MIMKQNIILLLLLMFSINIQAQSIKVSKTDKFTKDKVVYTSYEKISSEPLIMGRQLGKTIWICFGHENGLDMMLMKWMSINVYIAKRNESKVIFLDEDDNTHIFTISDYAAGHGEGTVGALGMDSWGIRYLLLGDLSVFKNKLMTSVRIYTTDGYFDLKSKRVQLKKQGTPIVYLRKKYRKEILINGNNSISKLITQ